MARTSEVVRILQAHGFYLAKHGSDHDIYFHGKSQRRAVVPRHKGEVPTGTYYAILRSAGINLCERKGSR
jgi:predicted RNA binding protein YcfA (HicA-like mRNA interferase family)